MRKARNNEKNNTVGARKGSGEKAAAVFFTAVVICCCAVLFLVSERGGAFLSSLGLKGQEAEVAQAASPAPSQPGEGEPLVALEDAIRAIEAELPSIRLVEWEKNERVARYSASCDGLAGAELEFSLADNGVSAFLLRMDAVETPRQPYASMSPVERKLFEKECEPYVVFQVSVKEYFQACAYAADPEQTLTQAELDRMMKLIFSAAEADATQTLQAGDFQFTAYRETQNGNCRITAALTRQ